MPEGVNIRTRKVGCLEGLTIDSDIDDIGSCRCRRNHAGSRNTSRVMRVYVDRQIGVLGADAANEPVRDKCYTRPMEAEDVRTYSLAASGLSKPAMSLMPRT